jgi:hypothetical protein
MKYGIGSLIGAMMVGMIIGVLIIGAIIVDVQGANRRDDAEGIAQCISEYEYTHPRANRFNNLVRAIRWCNVIDRAVAHECITPCTVILPKDTLEDEFGIDYGWRNRHTSTVDVYVRRP